MRLRRIFAFFGGVLFVLILFMIYLMKDLSVFPNRRAGDEMLDNKWLHFEDRIKQLETGLNKHHEAVNQLKIAMRNFIPSSTSLPLKSNQNVEMSPLKFQEFPASEMIYEVTCPIQVNFVPHTDVQMLDVYDKISFDNLDGGVWKQGWNIQVDEKEWNRNNKLKVFVIPHSHNDPGWIKTFDDYYISQTKHILNNMLIKLPEDPRRKFIWAEVSYFAMWWEDLNEDERESVRSLIRKNQLEIVTGGWVMNDEANSHWLSIIVQNLDGHQWLQQNLNYTPQSSWSIDPFGMSATQPLLLKEMGFRNMLIHRIHYSVKKHLAGQKQLEFRWRQLWDSSGKTDIFTHMTPFYSYDIPHTCGPDPKICCQFDFKRLPNHGLRCPWNVPPEVITDKNVVQRANLLLDQYRKKSKLYKTNVLLVPLGDDFRYDHPTEWDVQYNNYQKLFDYMNSHLLLNVKIQFGTLTDYFDALHKEMKESSFPTLSGDFFTYADRDDHYWSGYYTSRPFYKRMDRVLMSYIRSAEIILTLAHIKVPEQGWLNNRDTGLRKSLSDARKMFSLFQHHDAITGTAKDFVMKDYAKKMSLAIMTCQNVIQHSAHILLSEPELAIHKEAVHYNIDDIRRSYNELGSRYEITIGPELRTKKVVIFNSLTISRAEVVTFFVSTPYLEVLDVHGKRVECQVSPVFEYASSIAQTKYELSFIANMPALSIITYTINSVLKTDVPPETVYPKIRIYNQYSNGLEMSTPFEDFEISSSTREFTLQNSRVVASFNEFGLLKALKTGINTIPVHLDFVKYGVKHVTETSGAYLFIPDGEAVPITIEHTIVNVVEGPIASFVVIQLPYIRHTVRLLKTPGADGLGIEIDNLVDISKTMNFEIAMRLSTNINSSDKFFTDLNGYQILRRKRFTKLPLQANYYPLPTMGYIEDKETRLTVISDSPLGCSSLKPGQFEVMMDRRLKQDDNLGLGQGVLDNVLTRHVFRIILEKKTHRCRAAVQNYLLGFPTLSAYAAMVSLLHPPIKLLRTKDHDTNSLPSHISMDVEYGVDYFLASLRNGVLLKGKDHIGLTLHRQFIDVCFADKVLLKQFPLSHGSVNLSTIFLPENFSKLYKTSLTFLLLKNEVDLKSDISLCPMELQSFVLRHNKLS